MGGSYQLAGQLFQRPGGRARRLLVIAGGLGVRAQDYRGLRRFLGLSRA